MNIIKLNHYQFYYYICRNTQENTMSVCLIPLEESLYQLSSEQNPKKTTYEIYNFLEEELGENMSFKPIFSDEVGLYEVEISNAYSKSLELISYQLTKSLQAFA